MMKITPRSGEPTFFDEFMWPTEGVVVPDDFLQGRKIRRYLDAPQIRVEKSEDGEEWTSLSAVDRDAGTSPPGAPAPADGPPDYAGARRRGIIAHPPRTTQQSTRHICRDCGAPLPLSEVQKGKTRHTDLGIECMTTIRTDTGAEITVPVMPSDLNPKGKKIKKGRRGKWRNG